MCGRVTLELDEQTILEVLKEVYEVENAPEIPAVPAYNIGPSEQVLSVIQTGKARRAGLLTYGLVPGWTKEDEISHGLFNARSETVTEKPTFREAFARRRCIVLASRFYEWKRGKVKRPFLFEVKDRPVIPLAGIYNVYKKADGSRLSSCAVLTCEPNAVMAPIHNRMPVILTREGVQQWLNPTAAQTELQALLMPYSTEQMTAMEVSTYVNNIRNKGTQCVDAVVRN